MSNPKQSWLIRYSYDPLNKLASHSQSDSPERHRFYCKNRLGTEIQGAIGHSIVQYDDFLLAQQQREKNAFDSTLLATDGQRSVLHTLKQNTERQSIAYCPFGHRTVLSGPLSLLGFNGEKPDPVTGHYLLGNRYRAFNPVLMRFNSPDSLSPFGKGGLNSYSYCLGDPVNLSDPNGHVPGLGPISTLKAITRKPSKLGKTVKPAMSDTQESISTPAITASNIDTSTSATPRGLFGNFEGSPHLIENIVQRLEPVDMVALAQTSSEMRAIVYSSARALPNELNGLREVILGRNGPYIHGAREGLEYILNGNIQRIGSGRVRGILPVQIPRAGIRVSFPAGSINTALGHSFRSGPFTFEQRYKTYTLRTLT